MSGPTTLPTPQGVERVDVVSAAQMAQVVLDRAQDAHVVVMTAAVADFRPRTRAPDKLKKDASGGLSAIPLEPTADILAALGAAKGDRVLIGFAMETADLVANARAKLERKNLDLIVGNDLNEAGAGFGTPTNVVTLVSADGVQELPLLTKEEVAMRILDRAVTFLG